MPIAHRTSLMPPRRSHKKSRAGCRRCKSRKIKCDEGRPRCRNCDKHGVPCDFEFPSIARDFSPQTPRTPATPATPTVAATTPTVVPATPAVVPPTPTMSMTTLGSPRSLSTPTFSSATPLLPTSRLLELRLLHHYTTVTSKTLSCTTPRAQAEAEVVWRENVPRVAFADACGSTHLTDAVLAVAALHLRSMFPQDRELIRASHGYMAASLSEYNRVLQSGITPKNAEALFLNSTLIAFQSTATRIFSKDEPTTAMVTAAKSSSAVGITPSMLEDGAASTGTGTGTGTSTGTSNGSSFMALGGGGSGGSTYTLPMSWFHSFQGVKAITAASWPWLRRSGVVLPIINAQPALHLDIASAHEGFFGHLLDDLDEELDLFRVSSSSNNSNNNNNNNSGGKGDSCCANNASTPDETARRPATPSFQISRQIAEVIGEGFATESNDEAARTRHAYQHAVAVLNWAHGLPQSGACLAFPATVSRRFVDLLSSRTPRALTILACFFAMLKTMDSVWWLQGMARREVLGVVSLFTSDAVPVDVERRWWPHMQWAVRVALYHDDQAPPDYVPPDVWGSSWLDAEAALHSGNNSETFVSHIDKISESIGSGDASVLVDYPGTA